MSILEDAQRALELEQKATPGPWCHMQPGVRSLYNEWYDTYDWLSDNPQAGLHKKIIASRGSFYGGEPDYAFVAAARTGWPTTAQALIDLHKAAQAVVDVDKSAISISIGGNLQGAIEKLAEKLEELQ